ncbi:META domain-containing protein [Lewinella sp. W8]|uniref:META domain-containing protein n=1 Tax=Lewinella sp. W8 TaxID=2528208 RepID=UPI001067B794|nr:META domain-containing protein [Lewinella sp. W8]MTB49405.1 META domain-containing protein [Lewinella sp. W8]
MHRPLFLVFTILSLMACQPKPDASAGEQSAKAVLPVPSEWVLVSCEMEGKVIPAVNDRAFVKISDGQIGGNTGCNSFGGDWQLSGAKLNVPGVMATKMFCQEASSQEQLFLNILNGDVGYAVTGDRLTLSGASGQLNFRRKDSGIQVSEKQVTGIVGLFTYMADAPGFERCEDGMRMAVLQEGEAYRELERTYLELGRPGEPALLTVEGDVVDNPAAEGHPKALRIRKVRKLSEESTCP